MWDKLIKILEEKLQEFKKRRDELEQEFEKSLFDANWDKLEEIEKRRDMLKQELEKTLSIANVLYIYTREPHISDYYESSYEMEEYQHIVVGLIGLGVVWAGYKLMKSMM